MFTPWGIADHITTIADGIYFVSTPSHGGFKVDKDKLRAMPEHLKRESGWYEEDCEACKVVLAFPEYFTKEQIEDARIAFGFWFNEDGNYKKRT